MQRQAKALVFELFEHRIICFYFWSCPEAGEEGIIKLMHLSSACWKKEEAAQISQSKGDGMLGRKETAVKEIQGII